MLVSRLVTICAVAIVSRGAIAQRVSSTLDAGATSMRYADSINASGLSITPTLRLDWPHAIIRGTGTYAQLGPGHWSTQGYLATSLLTPVVQHLSGEFSLSSGGSAHFDGTRTGQSTAELRGHLDAQQAGLWVGGGGGLMWDGFTWHSVALGELGSWARLGNVTLIATTTPTRAADTTRYVDSEVDARYESSYVTLDALGGFRGGRAMVFRTSSRAWGGGAITIWPTSHVGVVISGGTYPVDLTQGFPGGQYLLINVRVGSRPRGWASTSLPLVASLQNSLGSATSDRVAIALVARQTEMGSWELRVEAPTAGRVELNADFTGWQPTSLLSSSGGSWTLTIPLAPGTHQVNLRIDGGPWIVPAGLLPLADEFGGRVGLLVIP